MCENGRPKVAPTSSILFCGRGELRSPAFMHDNRSFREEQAPPLPVEMKRTEIRLFSGGGTPPLQIWIQCKQLSERPGSRWLLGARGSQSEIYPRVVRLSVHEQLYLAILCEISWKGCGGNIIFRLRNIIVATERCDVLLQEVFPTKNASFTKVSYQYRKYLLYAHRARRASGCKRYVGAPSS